MARGHDVTLFATADSTTRAHLHAHLRPHGYWDDREHVAVGALRDAEPRRGGRTRARVRHHPLRGGVLSDVARVSRGSVPCRSCRRSITRRAPPKSRCGRDTRKRRSSPSPNEQARLPVRRQRRRHGAARHRHRSLSRSGESPTTICCSSAASRRARACFRRSRWRATRASG